MKTSRLDVAARATVDTTLRATLRFAAATALLAGLSAGPAAAAPRAVEAFETGSWARLQATLKQPTVVVFSTTDCAHCPAVFEMLARQIRQRQLKAKLVAVVMDLAPGDDDAGLKRDRHFQGVDRLFAFAGQAPALRYAVEPRWRGVTPYVVFLTPQRPALAVTGPPSPADVDAWVAAAGGAAVQNKP